MKPRGSTAKEIENRRNALRKIILEVDKKGRKSTRKELLAELAKKGFKIDISTLYRDRTVLNTGNSFVLDISKTNYSAYMEEIWNNLETITEEAIENYHKNYSVIKTTERERNGVTERVTERVQNRLETRHKFLKLLLDGTMAKLSVMSGESLNASVAMIDIAFRELKDKVHNYEIESYHKTDEIDKLLIENLELKKKLEE